MSKRRRRLGIYLGLFVSALSIIWIGRSVEEQEIFQRVREVKQGYLVLAVLLTVMSYMIRAWRWPFFFPERALGYSDSYRCLIIGFFMNNVLPARIGELVRAHLGGRAVHCSRTLVLATIAGERLADGLAISVLFAVLFTLGARPEELEQGKALFYVASMFAVAAFGTIVVIAFRNRIFDALNSLGARFSGDMASFALLRLRRFVEGLEPLMRPKTLLVICAVSAAIWCIELLVYSQVALAFNTPLSIGVLSLFLAAVNFSSLIPAAPAGIGVIEAFATAALVHVGVDRETAFAMVATQHLIQIAVVGLPGSFLFFVKLGGKVPLPEEGLSNV